MTQTALSSLPFRRLGTASTTVQRMAFGIACRPAWGVPLSTTAEPSKKEKERKGATDQGWTDRHQQESRVTPARIQSGTNKISAMALSPLSTTNAPHTTTTTPPSSPPSCGCAEGPCEAKIKLKQWQKEVRLPWLPIAGTGSEPVQMAECMVNLCHSLNCRWFDLWRVRFKPLLRQQDNFTHTKTMLNCQPRVPVQLSHVSLASSKNNPVQACRCEDLTPTLPPQPSDTIATQLTH